MNSPEDFSEALAKFRDSQAIEQEQAEFEIGFFGCILDRNPTNVDVIRRLVEHLSRRANYDAALPLYRKLVNLRPNDCIARYNLSCTLSMLGHIEEAVSVLKQAFEIGYCDIAHLETDADMEPLRDHPGYVDILEKYDDSMAL